MPLFQDVRLAARTLAKDPGFTLIAMLTLALGIGANTAIFSVINAVLLSPLRYPDADRIVAVFSYSKQTGSQTPRLSGGDLVDIRDDNRIFDALSFYYGGEMGVQLPDRSEFTGAFFVTSKFFQVFGAQPVYGRLPAATDADGAAVVSEAFAQRNFGSGQSALGKTVRIEGRAYQISGVLPAGFAFPSKADVWVPEPPTPRNLNRTAYNYATIAKLKPGVTLEAARAELDTIGARLAISFPDSNRDESFTAVPLRDQLVGPARTTLLFLMGAVALVLLIACTNVADLMLARATARSREMAVRTALGARRWHILRPLLVESALLALGGGTAGLLLAQFGAEFLLRVSVARNALPSSAVLLDARVLAFVTGVSLLASLLFGLIPAWQAARLDPQEALKQAGSRGLVGGSQPRVRNALVVAQIALSLVLAIGAGLLLRSFAALTSVQLGYRTEGILVMYAHAPAASLNEYLAVGRSFEKLFAKLSAVPGVSSVAGVMGLPTGQYSSAGSYAVEGKHVFAPGQRLPDAGFRLASPGYFATMGIPVSRGRDFSANDLYDSPFVAVISEALARESFPHEDPIGKRLRTGFDSSKNWMTIIGVVGDVRQTSPASPPEAQLYMPLQQHPYYANELQVVIRTPLDPGSLISAVRGVVRAETPETAMKFTRMDAMVSGSIAKSRFQMFLISMFAGLALVLAMVGVYGVMSYVISQRASEFGLRVAMGATPKDVVALVLRGALRLTVSGILIGLAISLAASRVLASMLFELKPTDALTYAMVVLAVAPVILLAAAIPAWRAARVDAMIALRQE